MFNSRNYFSPWKQQKQSAKKGEQEGQVAGIKGKELRVFVPKLVQSTFISVQGQVCSKLGDDYYLGSGTICIFGTSWQQYYFLLTCAHNLVQVKDGYLNQINEATDLEYRYSQLNRNNYCLKAKARSFSVYPGYKQNHRISQGYDIGFALLDGDFSNAPISKNSFWSNIDKENAQPGETILVIGYPAEYDGQLYLMQGTIKEIRKVGEDRKLIFYNNLNTSGGQSGSPIYLVRNGKFTIIGVHVGYDGNNQANVGTALTESIYNWIYETYFQLVLSS